MFSSDLDSESEQEMSLVEECVSVASSECSSSLSSFYMSDAPEPRGPYYLIEINGMARKLLSKIRTFLNDHNSAEAKFEMKPETIPDMLITDSLTLSPKMMLALRTGVPVVSLQWVFDCIKIGRLFDPSNYVLVGSNYMEGSEVVFNKSIQVVLSPQ